MVLMALFVFSFIAVASLSADQTQKITGTVMSINAKTGEMIVKDTSGEMKTLMADPKSGVNLKMLKAGDPVSVVSDSDGVIKSLKVSE